MGSTATLGDVNARLTADTASFDAKIAKSGEAITRHAALTEKASARARAAWEKELLAQDRAQRALEATGRAKELAALKSDILARSVQNEAKATEEATISNMQATSAAVRSLHGGFQYNQRSVERWLSQSKLVSAAAQVMFPVVGAVTFGYMVGKAADDVVSFIEKVRAMPAAIQAGFASLHVATMLTTDELNLTNAELQNTIDKLEKKPQNDLAVELYEARVKADELAKSLEADEKALRGLMSQNKVGAFGILGGQASTSSVSGSLASFTGDLTRLGTAHADAVRSGDKAGAARLIKQIADKQDAELAWIKDQLHVRDNPALYDTPLTATRFSGRPNMPLNRYEDLKGDQSDNRNILLGAQQHILDRREQEAAKDVNASLVPLQKKLQGERGSGGDGKVSAARYHAMELELNREKQIHSMSVKEEYEFWAQRVDAFQRGSQQYDEIVARQAELAVSGATKAHEAIAKFQAMSARRQAAAPPLDMDRARRTFSKNTSDEQGEGYLDSNRSGMEQARNLARNQAALLDSEAGKTITKFAAAIQLANVHTQEYITTQKALQGILNARLAQQKANPGRETDKGVADAQMALDTARANRGIQVRSDADAAYGGPSSGLVGAADALDEFVRAARDSASQMREFVDGTLRGFNAEAVKGMSGQRTSFGNFGAGMFRDVSGMALRKGEGSVLSAFGFGGMAKLGTKGNPMHTISEDATKGIDATGGWFDRMFGRGGSGGSSSSSSSSSGQGGGVKGFFANLLGMFGGGVSGGSSGGGGGDSDSDGPSGGGSMMDFPMFASGGPISANTWAIVGERGPELFHSGGGGHIVPNDELRSAGGGGDTHHWNIDARGSTDPAQTEAAVHRAIMKATPGIMAGSVRAMHEHRLRLPPSRR